VERSNAAFPRCTLAGLARTQRSNTVLPCYNSLALGAQRSNTVFPCYSSLALGAPRSNTVFPRYSSLTHRGAAL